jgi:Protein of unknown function (DUF3309)
LIISAAERAVAEHRVCKSLVIDASLRLSQEQSVCQRLPARTLLNVLAERMNQTRGMPAQEGHPVLTTVLIIILILLLVGALPTWPYSSGWGYYPSGIVGVIVLILIILLLTGRL